MRPVPTLLAGLGFLAVSRFLSQHSAPELGSPAAPLGLTELVQGPADAGLEWGDFAGQVVVLEFFATW
jgi:hypothetical protein